MHVPNCLFFTIFPLYWRALSYIRIWNFEKKWIFLTASVQLISWVVFSKKKGVNALEKISLKNASKLFLMQNNVSFSTYLPKAPPRNKWNKNEKIWKFFSELLGMCKWQTTSLSVSQPFSQPAVKALNMTNKLRQSIILPLKSIHGLNTQVKFCGSGKNKEKCFNLSVEQIRSPWGLSIYSSKHSISHPFFHHYCCSVLPDNSFIHAWNIFMFFLNQNHRGLCLSKRNTLILCLFD